jgi:DNA repair protein RadC
MHLTQVAFLALFLAALTAAFGRGGRPEHQGGALLLGAALATPLLQSRMFFGVEFGIAAVDVVLLAGLVWLAFSSGRRWPVFAVAFQMLGVLTHLARVIAGPVHGDVYGHLLVLWSYPVALSLLWGSLREARQNVALIDSHLSKSYSAVADLPVAGLQDQRYPQTGSEELALLTQLLALHDLGPQSARVASDLIQRSGSFAAAVVTSPARLRSWGMDDRVVEALVFARKTTRTSLRRKLERRVKIDTVSDTIDYLHSELAHLPHEQVRVLYLSARNRLIYDEVHGVGTINEAPLYPREVIKRAIEVGAVKLVLAHNHPSGDPSPSREDMVMTKAIIEAGRHIGISVIDHFVIAATGHVSMKSAGLI